MTNPNEIVEIYAFVCKGIAGAPVDVYGCHLTTDPDDKPKPIPNRSAGGQAGYSYWALLFLTTKFPPPVIIHIYFEGPLPTDRQRHQINYSVTQFIRQFLE